MRLLLGIHNMGDVKLSFSDIKVLKYLNEYSCWVDEIKNIRRLFQFKERVNVILLKSVKEMSLALEKEVPEWAIGAFYKRDILILDYELWKERENCSFFQIVLHELIHVIIREMTDCNCPIWIDEGLAVFLAGQYEKSLHDCNLNCYTLDVYSLDYTHALFYPFSAKAIKHLVDKYGIEVVVSGICKSKDFKNDKIFGQQSMKLILS